MIMAQNEKSVIFLFDDGVTNGETVSAALDTQDFDYATIDVCATTSNDTTNNFTTLTLSEGLVSTAFTAIAEFTGDATNGFTIPDADTSDPQVVARFNVKLNIRERWLRLQAAALTNQGIWAMARLGYADETPTSASDLGVGVVVTG